MFETQRQRRGPHPKRLRIEQPIDVPTQVSTQASHGTFETVKANDGVAAPPSVPDVQIPGWQWDVPAMLTWSDGLKAAMHGEDLETM